MASAKLPQQLDAQDLVLCSGTVMGADFAQLIAAASAGGFDAVSLFPAQYQQARAAGLSDAALRSMLADNGLRIAELDPLLNWVPGHYFPSDAGMGVVAEDEFYRIADALGARSLNVVWALPEQLPEAELIEAFAALCDRAARHNLLAHIEFLPWAQINNVLIALRIVQQADRPNAGVMFDSWHHFRSGVDDAVLGEIPVDKIVAIQLNDAPRQAEDNLIEETMQRRRLLGDGDIDLVDIIQRLDNSGCNAPLGVEIFSAELQCLDPLTVGRKVGENLRTLLRRARHN
jgi:sugar phosphate isomerase/epimerase